MSRPGPPKSWTKSQRRRREFKERLRRVTEHLDAIEKLRELVRKLEAQGHKHEAAKVSVRIRTLQQQVRYIGVDPNETLLL